jgi:hypothetical protein
LDINRSTISNTVIPEFNEQEGLNEPTVKYWEPEWKDNEKQIYRVDVAGWRDKYILMPEGAQENVLRVESIGQAQFLKGDSLADGINQGEWVSPTEFGLQMINYYNPNAPEDKQFKETFVAGEDYQNYDVTLGKLSCGSGC